ncbi:cell surface protein [Levilactobacillus senmaizukei DSM 21775 = NBRC 103853]|uniref:Cell surface protein n=1 Tax=Levilactobacillus senmaizukei DSM 21775 = NBRC 103853 TaxID=1423803 RepID=A0A0R2DN75_9LACO|nr:cell surface protein [Levilactobacillus senmaizukei DSM 21775 = NBRC 103853]
MSGVVALMLLNVGAGLPLGQSIGEPSVASAAALNAAKLANGKYQIKYNLYRTGTKQASEAAQYLNSTATVVAKDRKATVTIKATKAGNQFLNGMTLAGQAASVKRSSSGNTYTFTKVNLKKDQTIGFKVTVPMGNQMTTMTQTATLRFKTTSLQATNKAKLSVHKIKAKARKLTGTATKRAKVTVKHGQRTLGQATVNTKSYTIKLKQRVKRNWKLKVVATRPGYRTTTKSVTVK